MIRGGSYFNAQGNPNSWYFDGGPQPYGHHAKFIRMWPGLDRRATIGFRCVMDATLPMTGKDLSGDCFVNMVDFAMFASQWRNIGCGTCNGADYTGDENITLGDFKEFIDNWLLF